MLVRGDHLVSAPANQAGSFYARSPAKLLSEGRQSEGEEGRARPGDKRGEEESTKTHTAVTNLNKETSVFEISILTCISC